METLTMLLAGVGGGMTALGLKKLAELVLPKPYDSFVVLGPAFITLAVVLG